MACVGGWPTEVVVPNRGLGGGLWLVGRMRSRAMSHSAEGKCQALPSIDCVQAACGRMLFGDGGVVVW